MSRPVDREPMSLSDRALTVYSAVMCVLNPAYGIATLIEHIIERREEENARRLTLPEESLRRDAVDQHTPPQSR